MRLPGAGLATTLLRVEHPILQTTIAGMHFSNPLGLAAGFDKNGRYIQALARLGFGYLELGTVTPRPQAGNPQPRLFRLVEDRALINRMGFNNQGAEALAARLRQTPRVVPLGVNIGKNRDTPADTAVDDYLACFRLLAPLANYIAVNVSSPNTPGLRSLQQAEPLAQLLSALLSARRDLAGQAPVPTPAIFVKLSPDETPASLDAALTVISAAGIDGIIVTNTTTERPASLRSSRHTEAGGLSGAPLRERATAVVRYLYSSLGGRLPIVGVGGIDGPQAAYERILAGASLLQLYTALIYEGPGLVAAILRGLAQLIERDGFSSVAEAVGAGVDTKAKV